jgi:ADP-ribosyl-[dinitrogen reductase] hydrolase
MKNLDDTGLDARQLRAVGAVMGALVGDAAGGVLEFMGRPPTQQEVDEAMQMPGGGVFELAPGQFTDDGEMTVSLVKALLAAKGAYRPELVAQHYCDWENSRPFDIGMATRAALGIPMAQRESATQMIKLVRAQALENNADSKANGSLMRASALGIAACGCTEEEAIALALADAQLTHPNPACQHSTAAYVLALRHLMLKPGDKAGAIVAAQAYLQVQNKEVSDWLVDAVSGNLPPAFPLAGFVRYGFTYAFHYLHSGASFERAVTETLLRGGDTDTNACIVGGLMGAYHGLNGLPKLALDGVLNCNTQLGQRRPENFTVTPVMHNLRLLSQYCLPTGSAS